MNKAIPMFFSLLTAIPALVVVQDYWGKSAGFVLAGGLTLLLTLIDVLALLAWDPESDPE
jgi:hypothetical protein